MSEKELNDILAELRGETKIEPKTELESNDILENFSLKREKPPVKKSEPKHKKPKKNNKKLAIIIAVVLIIAIVATVIGIAKSKAKDDVAQTPAVTQEVKKTKKAPVVETEKNPLTGEANYNEAAVGKRPVAVVVENEYSTESVKPQWAIEEADIVLEGESEYSTRLLMFWADYTSVPEKVGPTRSARPPFIRFAELFDGIFIHAGLSHSKQSYKGANTVFEEDNVDHINLLSYSEDGKYFARDKSRTSTIEHTGYLKGDAVPEMIEKKGFRTDVKSANYTTFEFNDEAKALSTNKAENIRFVFSTSGCPKKGTYTYSESKKAYTTTDFDSKFGEANVAWTNLIFLFDETEYQTTVFNSGNRQGQKETYCNYKLSSGKGMVCSQGTYVDITWGVKDGKLWMKDTAGNPVKLNPGKSYIGYGSSNHGGSITIE